MSNERQINYVNEIQNRVQNLYYVDDATELNSINLKENDKIYAINDDKLFQMEIADQEEELSGSIVSFNGRNNTKIKSVVTNIEPVQDLHGMPNPYLAGASVNLIPDGMDTSNGYVHNAYLTAYGIVTSIASTWYISEYFEVNPEITYTLSCRTATSQDPSICFYDSEKTFISGFNYNKQLSYTFIPPEGAVYARASQVQYSYQDANPNGQAIQLEIGSTATAYRRYSNICPISGQTGINISHVSKNLLGGIDLANRLTLVYGNTYMNYDDKTLRFPYSGTVRDVDALGVKFKPNTQYTFILALANPQIERSNMSIVYTDDTVTYIPDSVATTEGIKVVVSAAGKTVRGLGKKQSGGTTYVYYDDSGIFEGVLTAANFVPYVGQTLSINWQDEAGMIYGGAITLNEDGSVDLYSDRAMATDPFIVMGRADEPTKLATRTRIRIPGAKTYVEVKGISNKLKFVTQTADRIAGTFYGDSSESVQCLIPYGVDETEFLSDLQICYKLASPRQVHLDSIGELHTYLGTNSIWSDIDDITVKIAEKGMTAFELKPYN